MALSLTYLSAIQTDSTILFEKNVTTYKDNALAFPGFPLISLDKTDCRFVYIIRTSDRRKFLHHNYPIRKRFLTDTSLSLSSSASLSSAGTLHFLDIVTTSGQQSVLKIVTRCRSPHWISITVATAWQMRPPIYYSQRGTSAKAND